MSKWEHQFERYHSLVEEVKRTRKQLRFNRCFVQASHVALQHFCEKKVEMIHLHGDIETESKILGAEGHERLLQGSTHIDMRSLWKEIYGNRPVLALEMLILARYQDVFLVGRPDSILFTKGVPNIIFEYKFSKYKRPFRNNHVQARTYGLLLGKMGFDTEKLLYAIVLADPIAGRCDRELRTRVYAAVMKNGFQEAVLSVESARIFVHRFTESEAKREVNWALEFWKNRRGALPTMNPNKCVNCEYNTICRIG